MGAILHRVAPLTVSSRLEDTRSVPLDILYLIPSWNCELR